MDTPIYAAMCEWIDVRRRAFAAPVWPVVDLDDGPDRELTVRHFLLPDCCPYWPDVERTPDPDRPLFSPTIRPITGCWEHAA